MPLSSDQKPPNDYWTLSIFCVVVNIFMIVSSVLFNVTILFKQKMNLNLELNLHVGVRITIAIEVVCLVLSIIALIQSGKSWLAINQNNLKKGMKYSKRALGFNLTIFFIWLIYSLAVSAIKLTLVISL